MLLVVISPLWIGGRRRKGGCFLSAAKLHKNPLLCAVSLSLILGGSKKNRTFAHSV